MKTGFYDFFFSADKLDRSSAIRAVVAGSIAGGFLILIGLMKTTWWWQFDEKYSERVGLATLASLVAACVTLLTWNRILIGPILGLLASAGLIAWMAVHGEIVALGLLGPLFIGGFWSAARGICFLKKGR